MNAIKHLQQCCMKFGSWRIQCNLGHCSLVQPLISSEFCFQSRMYLNMSPKVAMCSKCRQLKVIQISVRYYCVHLISLPGHSTLQDWVSLPSAALHVPPFVAAVLVLVLIWSPVPLAAAQAVPQLDHGSQLPHWQSTEKSHNLVSNLENHII